MQTRIIGAIVALILAAVGAFVLVTYVRGADARAADGAELADVYIVEEAIPRARRAKPWRTSSASTPSPSETSPRARSPTSKTSPDSSPTPRFSRANSCSRARFIDPHELAARGDVPVPAGMQLVSFTLPADRVVGGQVRAGDQIGLVGTVDPDETGAPVDVINPISSSRSTACS